MATLVKKSMSPPDAELGRLATSPAGCSADRADEEVARLTGVEKAYRRGGHVTRVLDRCDLTVRRGECVYLTGPSGSGKTTLLSIIGCVLRADAGVVHVVGRDASSLSERAAADIRRTQIGFAFQRFHLVRGLSALENVCLPLVLDGVAAAEASRRAMDLLDRVGLSDKARCDPRRLSVGQCQRVALARAMISDPDLILADEPTASLDAEHGQLAMRLLRGLTVELGKTAVVVTHDPRIETFADRILVMDQGRLTEKEPPFSVNQHSDRCMSASIKVISSRP